MVAGASNRPMLVERRPRPAGATPTAVGTGGSALLRSYSAPSRTGAVAGTSPAPASVATRPTGSSSSRTTQPSRARPSIFSGPLGTSDAPKPISRAHSSTSAVSSSSSSGKRLNTLSTIGVPRQPPTALTRDRATIGIGAGKPSAIARSTSAPVVPRPASGASTSSFNSAAAVGRTSSPTNRARAQPTASPQSAAAPPCKPVAPVLMRRPVVKPEVKVATRLPDRPGTALMPTLKGRSVGGGTTAAAGSTTTVRSHSQTKSTVGNPQPKTTLVTSAQRRTASEPPKKDRVVPASGQGMGTTPAKPQSPTAASPAPLPPGCSGWMTPFNRSKSVGAESANSRHSSPSESPRQGRPHLSPRVSSTVCSLEAEERASLTMLEERSRHGIIADRKKHYEAVVTHVLEDAAEVVELRRQLSDTVSVEGRQRELVQLDYGQSLKGIQQMFVTSLKEVAFRVRQREERSALMGQEYLGRRKVVLESDDAQLRLLGHDESTRRSWIFVDWVLAAEGVWQEERAEFQKVLHFHIERTNRQQMQRLEESERHRLIEDLFVALNGGEESTPANGTPRGGESGGATTANGHASSPNSKSRQRQAGVASTGSSSQSSPAKTKSTAASKKSVTFASPTKMAGSLSHAMPALPKRTQTGTSRVAPTNGSKINDGGVGSKSVVPSVVPTPTRASLLPKAHASQTPNRRV